MAVSIHGNNGFITTNGTAAAPSLAAPDTDTGFFFDTNTIKATTSGSERLRITADGKVGIGIVAPDFIQHNYHATDNVLALFESGDEAALISFQDNNSSDNTQVWLGAQTNDLRLAAGSSERLRIHADGEVECKGGAAGQNALLVTGNYSSGNNVDIQTWQRIGGAVAAKMVYKDASTDLHFGSDTAHSFSLMTGGSDRIKIANNSAATSIGGAMTFNAMLTVQGDLSGAMFALKAAENTNRLMISGTDSNGVEINLYDGAGGQRGILGVSSGEFFIKAPNSSAPMNFYTHNGSSIGLRLKINSAGDVLLGTDQATIGCNTADGSDNRSFSLCGGSDASQSRGSVITIYGNEANNGSSQYGVLSLKSGNTNSGFIDFWTQGAKKAEITKDGVFRIQSTYNGSASTSNAWPALNITNLQGSYTANNIIGGVTFGKAAGHTNGIRAGILAIYQGNGTEAGNVGAHLSFRTSANGAGDSNEKLFISDTGVLATGNYRTLLDQTMGSIQINGGTSGGRLGFRGTTTSSYGGLGEIHGYWGTNKVASILFHAGTRTGSGQLDDGEIRMYTRPVGSGGQERFRITSEGKFVMRSQGATASDGYAALEIRQNTGGKHLVLATNSATSSTNEVMLGFKLHPSGQDERIKGAIICRGTGSGDYGNVSRMSFCVDPNSNNDNATIASHERMRITSGATFVNNNLNVSGELMQLFTVAGGATTGEFRNAHSIYGGGVRFRSNNTYGTVEIMNYNRTGSSTVYNSTGGWHWTSNMQFHSNIMPWNDNTHDCGSSSKRWDDIYATNSSIQTSDRNEKNTIVTSDLGLSFINKLKPVSYKLNGKTRTHYGLIAQDVETVLSDISKPSSGFAGFIKTELAEEKYDDAISVPEGKKVGDIMTPAHTAYGLRYNEFIAPLIKAIQELSAKVDSLETEVAALKGS